MFDLILIVTCVDDKYIDKMLTSVFDNNSNLYILIIFVNQSNYSISSTRKSDFNQIVEISSEKLPLSKARNIAIKYIFDNNLKSRFVMFPDDDTTFDSSFFQVFNSSVSVPHNYLINVYKEGTKNPYRKFNLKEGDVLTKKHIHCAMSVNMIINFNVFERVKYFDEKMGVGSIYGSSEDIDYYIRACEFGSFTFVSKLYNYHPSNLEKLDKLQFANLFTRMKNYTKGYIYFLKKHNLRKEYFLLLLRAIFVGTFYLVQLKIKVSFVYFLIFFYRIYIYPAVKID
jgi:hypothetical protein